MNSISILLGLPNYGWHSFGYYPSGGAFVALVIVVILMLLGKL